MEREALVKAVRDHPVIWDCAHKDHRNLMKIDQAWERIARELAISDRDARTKWKNLRDSWVKKKRALNDEPSAAKKIQSWPLWELMSFLKDVGSYPRTENITIDGDELESLQPPKRKKPKPARQDDDEYIEAFREATSTLKGAFQSTNDEDINFCRTLIAGLQKLQPLNKLKARTELLAVLTKYQMEEIDEDGSNHHQPSPPLRRVVPPLTSTPKKSLNTPWRDGASP